MDSREMSRKWTGTVLGACLLLGAGLAQAAAPICTLTAVPLGISVGGSTMLTATCPGVARYAWTGSGVPASPSVVSSTLAVTPAGSGNMTYTVKGTWDDGATASASIVVAVAGGAPPLSACTAITPAAPSVTLGSASPQLTATCSNTPTAYVWKVGTAALACTGAACTVPAASLPAAGTYTMTVKANNAGGTGTQAASATITVTAAASIVCPQTITEKPFDYATPGVTQHLVMNRGKAIAIKFTTDSLANSGQVQTNQSTIGANVYKFMNLSKNKCDFSYTSMDTRTGCSSTGGTMTAVRYTTGTPEAGKCTLQKNTVYYANIRNEDARPATETYTTKRGIDTCPAGATCGFVGVLY